MGRRLIKTETVIKAPAERVWAEMTDFASFPDWNPFVRKAQGRLEPGEQLKIQLRLDHGLPMTFKPRVTVVEPERELRWLGTLPVPGLFNGEHIFRLEPAEGERSRFLHGERFTGLLIPFMGGVLTKTERGYRLMNEALKRRVEAGG